MYYVRDVTIFSQTLSGRVEKEIMSILVVDDSQSVLMLLTATLKKSGYTDIHGVRSAVEAFRVLGLEGGGPLRDDVDLILMDVYMDGIDGIEACSRIKKVEAFKDVPVVVVTSIGDAEVLEKAFVAGAVDYIVKPFKELEFLARVRSVLRMKNEIDRRKMREAELVEVTHQLEEANRRLRLFSYKDGLTDICNRRYFDEFIVREWGRGMRQHTAISMILLDIDYFKAYNDSLGHLEGDECLKKVAKCLAASVHRSGDFVSRYGGEEFAIVLPVTDEAGAVVVAERIRQELVTLAISHPMSSVSEFLTASLGVATVVPDRGMAPASLVLATDQALYLAKRQGRNRFVIGQVE